MDDIDAAKLGIDPDLIEEILEEKAASAKRKRKPRSAARYIGAPLSFMIEVCRLTEGRTALVVALCIYRRTRVCGSRVVTLPTAELAGLGIPRNRKAEALATLQRAGLIKIGQTKTGQTARITLIWQPS